MQKNGIIIEEFETRLRKAADDIIKDIMSEYFNVNQDSEKTSQPEKVCSKNLDEIVSFYMHKMGIRANLSGYTYLKYAIIVVIKNPMSLSDRHTKFYDLIAEHFNIKSSNAERTIRNAIETACKNGNTEYLKSIFATLTPKPCNSRFIAEVADRIKLENPNLV